MVRFVIQITKPNVNSAYNSPFGRSIKKGSLRGRLLCKNYLWRVEFFHWRTLPGPSSP